MTRLLTSLLISSIFSIGCSDKAEEVWIDVRTQEEWDSGHLEYAHHIPHEEIAARIAEVTDNKDAVIHLYCRSGGRAGRAKTALEEIGFTQVFNDGGFEDLKKKAEANAGN